MKITPRQQQILRLLVEAHRADAPLTRRTLAQSIGVVAESVDHHLQVLRRLGFLPEGTPELRDQPLVPTYQGRVAFEAVITKEEFFRRLAMETR